MKKILIVLLSLTLLITIVGCASEEVEKPVEQEIEEVEEVVKVETKEPEESKESKDTLAQQNAVKKAEDYLKLMAFSKSGLLEQLEFDGFENGDAVYAVDKVTVDWKEQAVKKGKDYLEIMSFSSAGLIEQLEFDGFSKEEATYGVDKIGL